MKTPPSGGVFIYVNRCNLSTRAAIGPKLEIMNPANPRSEPSHLGSGVRARLRASRKPALIHLAACALAALVTMALIFLLWYPGALAEAQGVSRLVLIMIGVDVVIGPLITSIVYDPRKRHLWFDLMTIAAVQTVALLYGMQAIFDGRPAYVVFNIDRFDVIAANEVVTASEARAGDAMKVKASGPRWVAARLPQDPARRDEILFSAMNGGADLPQLPEFFVPLEEERDNIRKRMRPLDELRRLNNLDQSAWQTFLLGFGKPEDALGYLPIKANARDCAAILDAKSGEVVGIWPLKPNFGGSRDGPLGPKQRGLGLS